MIGQKLLHYEIVEKLGEGGMGVVYKARDTHLDRFVAIKVLTPDKVADPQRKARFVQEARAASALNHPNIVHIYDISADAGVDFIAMEYIAGHGLDQMIPRKGMRLSEALKIAVQVADAMARAHEAGIVHRDLKPSNVMVDERGLVKVVDFGLAKLTEAAETSADAPTRTFAVKTEEGKIAGTLAYMSPEQAEGRKLDGRSDIFAFGAVLYEMVTGRRAFGRDTAAATLAAVMREHPEPIGEVAPEAPRELEKLIARCLQKQPERRWQAMPDLRVALDELREESESGAGRAAISPAQKRNRWRWAALAVLPLLATGGWLLWRFGIRQAPPARLVQLTTYAGSESQPSFSPDGKQVAFSWNGEKEDNWDIYVKLVGETNALRLTSNPARDTWPVWSPDGKRIAFQRFSPGGASGIYLVSALGGAEQKLSDAPAVGQMSWSPDGKWLAIAQGSLTSSALLLLPADGGEPVQITKPKPPSWDVQPAVSMDGRRIAYAGCSGLLTCDLYVQALGPGFAPRGEPRRITQLGALFFGLAWDRAGESLIYSAAVTGSASLAHLWRANADGRGAPERLEVAGPSAVQPAVSPADGRLAFSRSLTDFDIWRYQPGGAEAPLIRSSLWDAHAQFSPDGKRIAFESSRTGEGNEIWTADADGANLVQLTSRLGRNQGSPTWSPDGRYVAFDSQGQDGHFDVYVIDANGGRPRRLTTEPSDEIMPNWSRDGQWIYFRSGRTGKPEVWRAPSGGGQAEQVTQNGGDAAFESFDGKVLFYTKDATSPLFSKPLNGQPEQQILDRVTRLAFAVTDNGIYYLGPRGEDRRWPLLFHQFSSGASREVTRIDGAGIQGMAVSPDGKTFLYDKSVASGADLMMIENFR